MSTDQVSLKINAAQTKDTLVEFLRTEFTNAGFSRAVVGLSGGIDSALACLLTVEALGPENVLALRMPYETSSPESLEHAQLIIDMTRIKALTIPITPMVDAYLDTVPEAGPIRSGNVMARMRMIILYDQSAAFNGLVVGTGNKTEILFGYTTLYGDSACALNPIGDLYKTQVRQLAAYMSVPEVILHKPPSADLWDGQTDEDELGFTYENVDQLLCLLIDNRYSLDECVEAGFDRAFVEDVLLRIQNSHFKRVLPPIAQRTKITTGYQYPYNLD
jgi:NAD+ synthase